LAGWPLHSTIRSECYKTFCTVLPSNFTFPPKKTYDTTLQRTNGENLKQIFPEKELRGHCPNFHIHVSLSDLCIPTNGLLILLQEISGPIL
jgi:hypothetical protein